MNATVKSIFSIFFVFFISFSAFSEVEIPDFDKKVVIDQTNTLSSHELDLLKNQLVDFEKTKGSQVVVLIVPTTSPETIEQFGIRVAEKWKIGRESIDDGVILIVAKNDRKMRIEVGYGLEGAIPDIYAKRIIENVIAPQFRSGHFYDGIHQGTGAIIKLINNEELPEVTSDDSEGFSISPIYGFLVIIVFMIIKAFVKNKVVKVIIGVVLGIIVGFLFSSVIAGVVGTGVSILALFAVFGGGGGSGGGGYYGGGSSYGGGYSGGGFGGGFSGGGGSFGGGGASGGW